MTRQVLRSLVLAALVAACVAAPAALANTAPSLRVHDLYSPG